MSMGAMHQLLGIIHSRILETMVYGTISALLHPHQRVLRESCLTFPTLASIGVVMGVNLTNFNMIL